MKPEKEFDLAAYEMGKTEGEKNLMFEGTNWLFTDDGEGNITMEEVSD